MDWAEDARRLCQEAGHTALIPLDGTEMSAEGIYRNNVALLQSADALLANLNSFRGAEPDSGTCVEVGMALALGKSVIGYIADHEPLIARVARHQQTALRQTDTGLVDQDGWLVEDFDQPLNLMLSVPVRIVIGGLTEALTVLP